MIRPKKVSVSYSKVLDKIEDLSPDVQKKICDELIEYIDFLQFKYTSKKVEPDTIELSLEQKKELKRRVDNAKRHPERLITWGTLISNLEKKFGKKISV